MANTTAQFEGFLLTCSTGIATAMKKHEEICLLAYAHGFQQGTENALKGHQQQFEQNLMDHHFKVE